MLTPSTKTTILKHKYQNTLKHDTRSQDQNTILKHITKTPVLNNNIKLPILRHMVKTRYLNTKLKHNTENTNTKTLY